ncbi:chorismate mutase [Bifidobacterium sp. SMB2]|uniref:Prephenate dehydratase n=1 Tax=Bifidobacterium saimiriisciurei TaxID=2661627 RepID=A0ABX0CBJ7_9BIFI|nr:MULTISPECIES: prephenate dehydratase domain-containing protein [Bifidobacterium]NEG95788.1 chorismate mutase [Bifidobacterium sp. SMB2]NEH11215.1 chorismate mutase [Bifidobacterium saimiriisciurei]
MATTLHYLGPKGSFTHQAALEASRLIDDAGECVAEPNVTAIFDAVGRREGWGVIAWENNVEGYVVPNLDALIDADDVVGFARIGIDISFDALVKPNHTKLTTICAHPHGLAQCTGFIADRDLAVRPTASNAAACRDITDDQVALAPSVCADIYGLDVLARSVQDFSGGRTEFLVLAPRDDARRQLGAIRAQGAVQANGERDFESIVAFILLNTGPGVLANLLDVLRYAGLNMTSFISRPIKGNDGTYSFIATFDAAPWQPQFKAALSQVLAHGDWVKTLAVYPRRERPSPPVSAWMLPQGGVHLDDTTTSWNDDPETDRELLWK